MSFHYGSTLDQCQFYKWTNPSFTCKMGKYISEPRYQSQFYQSIVIFFLPQPSWVSSQTFLPHGAPDLPADDVSLGGSSYPRLLCLYLPSLPIHSGMPLHGRLGWQSQINKGRFQAVTCIGREGPLTPLTQLACSIRQNVAAKAEYLVSTEEQQQPKEKQPDSRAQLLFEAFSSAASSMGSVLLNVTIFSGHSYVNSSQ